MNMLEMEKLVSIIASSLFIIAGAFFLYRFVLNSNQRFAIKMMDAVYSHFERRGEQPVEIRLDEPMANAGKRKTKLQLEVKTVHERYYRVEMEKKKVIAIHPINGFTN